MDMAHKDYKLPNNRKNLLHKSQHYLETDLARVFSKKGALGKMDHHPQMRRKSKSLNKVDIKLLKLRNSTVDIGMQNAKIQTMIQMMNPRAIQDSLPRKIFSQVGRSKCNHQGLIKEPNPAKLYPRLTIDLINKD